MRNQISANKPMAYVEPSEVAYSIAQGLDKEIRGLKPTSHRFLDRFAENGMTRDQLRYFCPQWYKTIRAHKHAFPGLVYTTPDELLRGDLLTILFDENGNGDPDKMHTRLFLKVPEAIGMTREEIEGTPVIDPVSNFGEFVRSTWLDEKRPEKSYGVVYVFENIGADFHGMFLEGLRKSKLPKDALEYSELHAVAEKEHAERVVNGLRFYEGDVPGLVEGVKEGSLALSKLWDGFESHVFSR